MPRCADDAIVCLRRRALPRLEGVVQQKKKPWQYRALCPAHDDQRQSLSITTGRYAHILYECHGPCDDAAVYAKLIELGIPRDCLAKPKASSSGPQPENTVIRGVTEILYGPGTPAQRLVLIAIAASGGEIPRGEPECEALGSKIRVSGRVVYRASEPMRRGLVR